MNALRNYADYEIPLLQVLNDLPGGEGTTREVKDRFGERFDDRIPDEQRAYLESVDEAKWRNMVAWTRNNLVKRKLMDSPAYGVWRITDAGRAYLVQVNASAQPVVAPMQTAQPSEDVDEDAASMLEEADLVELAEAEFLPAVREMLESDLPKGNPAPSFNFPQDGILQVRFSDSAIFYYQLHLLDSSAAFELYFEDTPRLNDACRKALRSHQDEPGKDWAERVVRHPRQSRWLDECDRLKGGRTAVLAYGNVERE